MGVISRPIVEATRSVRVSLDVEAVRRKLAERGGCRHPVATLLALVGDLQDEGDPAALRGLYVELAAVCQHAAGEIDREGGT